MGAPPVPSTKGQHDATTSLGYRDSLTPLSPYGFHNLLCLLSVVQQLQRASGSSAFSHGVIRCQNITASQGTVKVVKYCSKENNKKEPHMQQVLQW